MVISSAATAKGSQSLVAAAQNWLVTQPAGQAPRRYFQTVLYLRFYTDALTSGFVVDDAATVLAGAFAPHTYNGLQPDNPALTAQVSASGTNLIVKLDGPRQVLAVVPKASYSVELYRVDAGTSAAQPTVTSNNGNIGGPGFTDVTFAVVLKSGGVPKPGPTVNDLQRITLRGYPTGPRLGIADPDLQSIDFFWHANGEIGATVPAAAGNLGAAGPALAKSLTRYLDSAWQALEAGEQPPDHFEVALVIQSDAPCELDLTNVTIPYHRVLVAGDKQFLRFAGDRVETQSVPLKVPGNPAIISASLRTVESLQPRKLSSAAARPSLPSPEITARRGIRVNSNDALCAAQPFTPAAAVSATGLSVGVLALAAGTELSVEVRAGLSGAPSSAALASAKIAIAEPGPAQWVMVSFAKPAVIPAQPHWIVLTAAKGALVWFTEEDAGSVLTGTLQANRWNAAGSIDGARALFRVASADHEPGAQPTPHTAPDAWHLSLGSAALTGVADQSNGTIFDLTAPLASYLQTATPADGVTSVPIRITAMAKGGITVYAPRVIYDP